VIQRQLILGLTLALLSQDEITVWAIPRNGADFVFSCKFWRRVEMNTNKFMRKKCCDY
jgi:hypothetical protein